MLPRSRSGTLNRTLWVAISFDLGRPWRTELTSHPARSWLGRVEALRKFNVTFEERRRRTVTVTARNSEEARALVENGHGAELEELIATRDVRETAYCAQYVIVESVDEAAAAAHH